MGVNVDSESSLYSYSLDPLSYTIYMRSHTEHGATLTCSCLNLYTWEDDIHLTFHCHGHSVHRDHVSHVPQSMPKHNYLHIQIYTRTHYAHTLLTLPNTHIQAHTKTTSKGFTRQKLSTQSSLYKPYHVNKKTKTKKKKPQLRTQFHIFLKWVKRYNCPLANMK